MSEHPLHGPQADRLVSALRGLVDEKPDAGTALARALGQIGTYGRATVGVFGTLVNRVATADMQAIALAMDGRTVHPRLLEPVGQPTADHFVGLTRQAARAGAEYGVHSPQAAAEQDTLLASYRNLEASPEHARDALAPLAMRLVLHERLRGLDLSTLGN